MKKLTLICLILCAVPAFAQTSQVGILFGGSARLYDQREKKLRTDLPDGFDLGNSVREIWYGFDIEPDTQLRIKAGEITGPVGGVVAPPASDPKGNALRDGRIEHLDFIVDYRFDETFGSTGLFAGAGYYRQRSGLTDPATQKLESDYGFSVGANGDFPINRRYGVIIEGAYHWVNFSYKPRFITVTGGLRIRL